MLSSRVRSFPLSLLRIPSAVVLCLAAALVFLGFGEARGALGVTIGWGLYVVNGLLIYEIGRSLLTTQHGARRIKGLAFLSFSGRLGMLFVALALVAVGLGRAAVLGACVGLFLAQVNLHRSRKWL